MGTGETWAHVAVVGLVQIVTAWTTARKVRTVAGLVADRTKVLQRELVRLRKEVARLQKIDRERSE